MAKGLVGQIKSAQEAWARERNIAVDDDGYCRNLSDNLFQELTACSRRELEAGDGAELGKPGGRGKLQALHSSSALVCNVFDYWRGRDLTGLAGALGLQDRPCSLQLEGRFPTGLRGKPPNLDVALMGSAGTLAAIESKFTEPFAPSKNKNRFEDKYFPQGTKLWAQRGLHGAQELAEALQTGLVTFTYLGAAQLLKHCLGLANASSAWTLTYLWYDPGGKEAQAHADELATFIATVGRDGPNMVALSYQEFFSRLKPTLSSQDGIYRHYLEDRYFRTPGA